MNDYSSYLDKPGVFGFIEAVRKHIWDAGFECQETIYLNPDEATFVCKRKKND